MAWKLRTGGVSRHVPGYVYVRGNGVYGDGPPNMPVISPGVRRNPLPLADHRFHLDLKIISKGEVLIPSKPGGQGYRNIGRLEARIVSGPLAQRN